jgi:hypothetical protein
MLADIYQLLGLAWEFAALQCPHRSGWRKSRDGKLTCKVCGTIKDASEHWLLLPRHGEKTIGRRVRPTTKQILPNRKAATVVKDEVNFHGAKLSVEVLNPHLSRLFRTREVTIAPDRLVALQEDNVECRLNEHMLRIRFGGRPRGSEPPFADFLAEIPKRALKKLPVLAETDRQGRLVGLVVFKPSLR